MVVEGGKRLNGIIQGLHLGQEWLQAVQTQGAGAIALGVIRVRMGLQEQPGDALADAGAAQLRHLGSVPFRRRGRPRKASSTQTDPPS